MVEAIPINKTFSPKKIHPYLSNKFKRRCPMDHFYIPIECPLGRQCNNGYCPLSHTKLEIIFHPILHKTKKCKMSISNVCNFSNRCAFYHDFNDKTDAYLLWLDWKRHWNLWDGKLNNILLNCNISIDMYKKFYLMICIRDNPNNYLINNSMSFIEKELDTLINTCNTPETDTTTPLYDDIKYLHQSIDEQFNLLSLYK